MTLPVAVHNAKQRFLAPHTWAGKNNDDLGKDLDLLSTKLPPPEVLKLLGELTSEQAARLRTLGNLHRFSILFVNNDLNARQIKQHEADIHELHKKLERMDRSVGDLNSERAKLQAHIADDQQKLAMSIETQKQQQVELAGLDKSIEVADNEKLNNSKEIGTLEQKLIADRQQLEAQQSKKAETKRLLTEALAANAEAKKKLDTSFLWDLCIIL